MKEQRRIFGSGIQADVTDQRRRDVVKVTMQQADQSEAGGERDEALEGLHGGNRAQRSLLCDALHQGHGRSPICGGRPILLALPGRLRGTKQRVQVP